MMAALTQAGHQSVAGCNQVYWVFTECVEAELGI